jgi:hypothetical protein
VYYPSSEGGVRRSGEVTSGAQRVSSIDRRGTSAAQREVDSSSSVDDVGDSDDDI